MTRPRYNAWHPWHGATEGNWLVTGESPDGVYTALSGLTEKEARRKAAALNERYP